MSAEDFGPASARCKLFAEGTRPSVAFDASGSQKAVAIESGAAILLGGLAIAAHDSETYDNCMQAQGWQVVDNTKPQPVVPAAAGRPAIVQQVTQTALAPPVGAPAIAQPVSPSPAPASAVAPSGPPAPSATPAIMQPISPAPIDPRAVQHARALEAAEAWVAAERVLNGPNNPQRQSLYSALCDSGDQSACLMAAAR